MRKYWLVLLISVLALMTGCSVTPLVGALSEPAAAGKPYEDWRQQEVPFGQHSYYLTPWRSYMDTWDKNKYLDALGIAFNVQPREADAAAQMLAEAGIVSARVEIGWNGLRYEDDSLLRSNVEQDNRTKLQALARHGIRPLILLNSHSGDPGPSKVWDGTLTQAAASGSREIYLTSSEPIVPYYTGLSGLSQMMYPVITAYDAATGKATLSAPLPKALNKGALKLAKLKYQPFSGTEWADGKPNPAAQDTIDGWLKYVATVTAFVKDTLQSESLTDVGFDIEVWNELSFGYHFLDINNYYNPKLEFAKQPVYTEGALKVEGAQVIFPLTINYVKDPAHGLPGVRVINGFSNQRPWDNGTELWEGQDGFSRHYYTGTDFISSNISANNNKLKRDSQLNALGKPQQTSFIPVHTSSFPERWYYAYQTEFIVRDLQPFPGPWSLHHRFANPGNGQPAEVWMTETNLYRGPFAEFLSYSSKVPLNDPRMAQLMHHIGAKSTLRNYIFQSHKGVKTLHLYAAKEKDHTFAVLPEAFYTELKNQNYQLTESVRRAAGPQLVAVANVTRLMQSGERIELPRAIGVSEIKAHQPQLVFKGNGTEAQPDRYQDEDLAVLPYQLRSNQYAIGYYIVTRNLTQAWDNTKNQLDPKRYDMPMQRYDVTLTNVKGELAQVRAYDPMTDKSMPVSIKHAGEDTLTVQLEVTDYPRFLIVDEADTMPLIEQPVLQKYEGGAEFAFTANVDGEALLTWGVYPFRTGGAFVEERYAGDQFRERIDVGVADKIDTRELPDGKVAYRWKGTIKPAYSEKYTFIIDSDTCNNKVYIDGKLIVEGCAQQKMGSIDLQAGQSYELLVEYNNPYNYVHRISLYWASASQPREVVAPAADELQSRRISVAAGERVHVDIPGLSTGEGVKLTLHHSGITASYPQWNYDVQGVLWNE
ncbi:hypothetical protein PA598K_04434 [Paenibacillus sp. 598K]|uniref:PA14 domain-containing protein n=1 Tax=Paenibacillus sp. 598K TaxID=1117987 RepID=UPI000FFA00AE|nr:PA14 domain-containing protein [Paenibacillus sp. 598K]GBF75995.1 hypothetical protein PA598K_04434 [Paenibacillus sp. 598K]